MDLSLLRELAGTFWMSFGVAAVAAYPVYRLLLRTKSRQIIDPFAPEAHQQKQGTPTMGGIIIVLGFLATLVFGTLTWGFDGGFAPESRGLPDFPPIYVSALVLFFGFAAIGFIDDFVVPRLIKGKRGLGWKQKIVLEIGLAALGAGIAFGWGNLGFWCALFLILFVSNAYNFVDGLDALAGSVLIFLAGGLLLLNMVVGGYAAVNILMAALIGAVIPFLFLNAPPAKVFMGDVGSLAIGSVLGLTSALLLFPGAGAAQHRGAPVVSGSSQLAADMILPVLVIGFLMIAELVPVPMQVAYYKL
ncbi:MAG TPA: hypothetical protein VEX38_10995, partial [Fimbriimonadaceae bacterium]|nr:hypothetical protein [Fimbriimonadaceae bacterium]